MKNCTKGEMMGLYEAKNLNIGKLIQRAEVIQILPF